MIIKLLNCVVKLDGNMATITFLTPIRQVEKACSRVMGYLKNEGFLSNIQYIVKTSIPRV